MKLDVLINYLKQLPANTDAFVYDSQANCFTNTDDKQLIFYLEYEKRLFFGTYDAFVKYIDERRASQTNA